MIASVVSEVFDLRLIVAWTAESVNVSGTRPESVVEPVLDWIQGGEDSGDTATSVSPGLVRYGPRSKENSSPAVILIIGRSLLMRL